MRSKNNMECGWTLRMTFGAAVLAVIFACGHGSSFDSEVVPTQTYMHSVEMDTKGKYYLYWWFDDESVVFEAWVRTKGWVGLGLSPNGGMRASDIALGWVSDGQAFLTDRHAIGNEMPIVDAQQNVELLEGKETEHFTMLKFKRKRVTCDVDDRPIEEGTLRFIFAWNDVDPVNENAVQYHGATQRGSRSLLLLDFNKADAEEQNKYDNLDYFDLTVHNVSLPSKRTTYWCRIQEVPRLTKKHHVVKVEPLVEPANVGVVHHIVIYFCFGNLATEIEGRECWEGNMPENATNCDTLAYGWAIGQGTFYYPDEAGVSIGGEGDPQFLNIEMHYDNPEGLTNVIDSSGLRFYYTDQLRQHDAGTLILGTTLWFPPMTIPPNAEDFRIDAYCSSKCTNKLPEGGINVFAVLLHTHLVGSKVWTKHIRDGKELEELGREDHYDFNYQQLRRLPKIVSVQPGDEFITSCVYNTKSRTNMTYGGSGSDNEMCFNFMMYYPRVAVQACTSSAQHYYPIHQLVMEKAMTGELHVDPSNFEVGDVYKLLDKLEWNEKNLVHFQNQLDHTHGYTESCAISKEGFGVFSGSPPYYNTLLKIKEPRVKDGTCALLSSATSLHKSYVTMATVAILLATTFWA